MRLLSWSAYDVLAKCGARYVALLFVTLIGVAGGPAAAEKVGVAAAVNPDAFSSLSGAPNQQLSIGKSIFYNERIDTTASGLVQVLLVDGSTFTVGPNSSLVIDKFVYDPKKKTGEVIATFSKGAMRFVGGKLSKNDGGVKVNTPGGALAIRGGIVQTAFANGKGIICFIYGDYAKLFLRNNKVLTAFEAGHTIEVGTGGLAGRVRPTTANDIRLFSTALSNNGNAQASNTGQSGGETRSASQTADANNIDQLISDANVTQITSQILAQLQVEAVNPTVAPPITEPQQTLSGTYQGYAIALTKSDQPVLSFVNLTASTSPQDMIITFDPATDTLSAGITVRDIQSGDGATDAYILKFGGAEDRSQYSSDQNYSAIESTTGTAVLQRDAAIPVFYQNVNATSELVGSSQGFCEECQFVKAWGSWTSEIEFDNGEPHYIDNLYGLWVAGNLPTIGELPVQGTATYSGDTIGNVAARLDNGTWETYSARGNMFMDWDFAERSGTMSITDFDAGGRHGPLNMSGTMSMPGKLNEINQFSGPLAGKLGQNLPISGGATGSFARSGKDPTAGIIGNWNARNSVYRANSIFAAPRN